MIDLRSDTVTKPSKEMMQAMFQAEVGDDVYKEDPTVNELERRVAEMFGMEDALFFPTGSMANQAAIKMHTQPGEQLICDKYAHVFNYEGGGASFNSGVSCRLLDGDRGMVTAAQVMEAINPPDFYHSALTTLVCLENTTNKGGGACYDMSTFKEVRKVCDDHNLGLHLDGARLWNALVATGQDPKEYGEIFDTISVCFSKGMGTPLGTVLTGKKEIMKKAMRVRKVLGGGMRQVGYMAAAAIYALDHNIDRLKQDHDRAKELGEVLKTLPYVIKVEEVETNIVIFEVEDELQVMDYCSSNDLIISNMGQGKLRLVTHLDYTHKDHIAVIQLFKNFITKL
ncbi:L-threonine aldolase [Nonlabens xylanidelens]|uniref:L-threonine aldolase n=1 Tax=Nonlabens xylanidelens TaxID=191564 RepID=A0A2S6INK6_9FLAO|nr:GntG family PLP-dependent aldolase [Nonlabens xylanidelens]PPK95778.1 L-threonine aldolase [Nonlabens xylanidelens]PQJ22570.1 threonine aldolase [Nonlabens xylanidelens]